MTVASPDAAYAQALARELSRRQLPRLQLQRHHGRRDRRRGEERARGRRGAVRRARLRRQHARRAHHARTEGDDAPRRSARGAARRPSWDSRDSAIWCSPAPTISRATAASGCCSPPAAHRRQALAAIGQAVEGYAAARAIHGGRRDGARRDAAVRHGVPGAVRGAAAEGCGARSHEPPDQGRSGVAPWRQLRGYPAVTDASAPRPAARAFLAQ